MSKTKQWDGRATTAAEAFYACTEAQLEVDELRKEVERLTAELTLCKNVMFKGGARLRSCGVSNYTIESVADSLDLYAKGV